jgi:hypothetical protein
MQGVISSDPQRFYPWLAADHELVSKDGYARSPICCPQETCASAELKLTLPLLSQHASALSG